MTVFARWSFSPRNEEEMHTDIIHGCDRLAQTQSLLRVGIVGCGRVAAHHIKFITETGRARVVALADVDAANARRLGEPYGIRNAYGSLEELLDATPVDVVHILTPPASHYAQAVTAINRGVHIFLEKPCTLSAQETEDLYSRAAAKGVLLCPDFIQLFHPAFQRARALIESGQLGRVVHVESYLSETVDGPLLREAKGLHWSYQLPGGILHNYITHPLYLALYWIGMPKQVTVSARSCGTLPQGLTDHLDVMLEGDQATACVVLSFVIDSQPSYYVQVFCERGVVLVNFDTFTVQVTRKSVLPRSLDRATSNFRQAYRLAADATRNIINFGLGRVVPYQGLQTLIPGFYASITDAAALPVSSELAIATTRTEEAVFAQAGNLQLDTRTRPSRQVVIKHPEKVLVTGATGYVGSQVVRQLVEEGYYVRALVRELSRSEALEQLGVEVMYGDVRDLDRVCQAAAGMDIVVHLAAGLRGSSGFILESCIDGTKNVTEAARRGGLKRVIYMSSLSVYDYVKLRDGEVITAHSPLEEYPEQRGAYSLGKRQAEDVALSHLQDPSPAWTILRPSLIMGKGADIFSPVGVKLGNVLFCLGAAHQHLRAVHVEDVGTAILQLLQHENTRGRVFPLSAPGTVTLQDYVETYIRAGRYRNLRVVYVPYWCAALGGWALETLRKLTGKGPNLNLRRLASLYRDARVDSSALAEQTGWQPGEGLLERLKEEAA